MTKSDFSGDGDQLQQEYSNEEVSEIIRVALLQANREGDTVVSRDELLTIAKEFGLTPEDLVRASEEVKHVDAEAAARAERRRLAWHDFKVNLVCYGVGIVGLFGMNMATALSDGQIKWWFHFPVVAYGAIILGHFIMAKFNPEMAYDMLRGEEEEDSDERSDMSMKTVVKVVKE
jgi:hypothetical protein